MKITTISACVRSTTLLFLALIGLLTVAIAAPAKAQTSSLCPVLNATVAYGGSVSINAGSCHAGFGLGNIATQASHGTGSVGPFGPNQQINYAHNGTSGTSDTFFVRDGNAPPNNLIQVNITITPPASSIVVTPGSLPALTAGAPFSQTLTSTGGTAPYTYAMDSGVLPPGLSLGASGVLSGAPTQRGGYTFSVRSQDAVGAVAVKGYTGSVQNPSLALASAAGTAVQGVAFSQALSTTGGVAPHTYALESGGFPAGIGISAAGVVSGTTSAAPGTYAVTLRVTDSSTGPGSYFELETFTLTVAPPPSVSISVSPASVAEDGAPNLVYTVTRSANLPNATVVNVTTSGTATSGTDYSGGVSTVSIPAGATTATITINPTADAAVESAETVILTLASGAGYSLGAPASATGTILNDDSSSTSPYCLGLSATVANGGSVSIDVTNCDGPFNIGVGAVSTPAHGTAVVGPQSGPGTQFVTYVHNGDTATSDSFTVEDEDGKFVTITVTISAPTSSIVVSPAALPALSAGAVLNQTLSATGGTAPYAFTLDSGSLPPGVSLSSGVLSGAPSRRGPYSFSIRAQDAVGAVSVKGYTGSIQNPSLTLSTAAATAIQGTAFSQTLSTTGGVAPYTYAIESGSFPSGIGISSAGVVSGTTSAGVGTYTVSLRVTDSSTGPGTYFELETFTMTVAPAPSVSIAVAPTSVSEDGATNMVYTVTRSANLSSDTVVNIGVSGSATSGTDYSGGVSTISIPAGSTTATITINPTADATVETDETVILTVSPGTGYNVGAPTSATGTILNDDVPSATIAVAPASVSEDGATNLIYTVTLSHAPSAPVSVNFTRSGTATSGTDYATPNSPLVVAAGATTATITVDPTADAVLEGDETVVLTLAAGAGYTVGAPAAATGTILNDDVPVAVSPGVIPAANAGQVYSVTLTGSGGSGPYSFAVTSGALPAGLTLSSTGVLNGTPTATGSFAFTVTATDSTTSPGPFSGSQAYTLAVAAPVITLTPPTAPAGTVGAAYSATISASGGTAGYGYAVTSGALPAGLALNPATGVVSGTPTAGGAFNFTITATDSTTGSGAPYTGSRAYVLTIAAPTITLNPATLTPATVGAGYTAAITASGGTSGYTFAITAGALPSGMSFAANGALSGTPTSAGAFNFTVTATDSSTGAGPFAGSRAYTLTVGAPTIVVAPASLPAAAIGAAYGQTLTASGGTGAYAFAVTAGTLPSGMTLGGGVLGGTPTAGGTFNFTISATDSSTGTGAPFTGSRAYALTVSPATVVIAPTALPAGVAGAAYNGSVTASGGSGPYSFAVTAGALPAGLALASDGTMAGAPTAAGVFNFTLTATDSSTGAGPYSGSRAYSVVISAPALTLTPATLTAGSIGTSYTASVTAGGGTAPYSYVVSGGSLPAGVTLSSAGLLSGTPTAGGSFNFTVRATDSTTGAGAPFSVSRPYALTIGAPVLAISPTSLPSGVAGAAYDEAIGATGGTAPYAYAVTAGALPGGLSLNGVTGQLLGTPTSGGAFNFTVTVTDTSGGSGPYTASQAYTLTVGAPAIVITTTLPDAVVAAPYSQTVTAGGGVSPYSFAVTGGDLPAGLSMSSSGLVSGAPTAGGSFSFTVTATDSAGGSGPFSGSQVLTLVVNAPAIALTPGALPDGRMEVAYSQTIVSTGGIAPYTYALTSGALPAGLSLASNGVLTGTPVVNGAFNFTITATDSASGDGPYSGSGVFTLQIAAPVAPVAGAVSANIAYEATNVPIGLALSGGTATSVAVATSPSNGVATASGLGITYTPTPGYYGADSFTYTATNDGGTSAPAIVSLVVGNPPAPVASNVTGVAVAYESAGTPINLSAAITGVHSSVSIASSPAHGSVSGIQGDVVTYVPAPGYFGPDSFTYRAAGPGGASGAATVSLDVARPSAPIVDSPDQPIVIPPPAGSGSPTPISVDLGAQTDGVVDGYRVTVNGRFGSAVIEQSSPVVASASSAGSASPQAAGTFSLVYTPAANFIGTDTVTVVAFGPGGDSAPAVFSFQVPGKAPDLSGQAVSNGSVTFTPTAGLVGGPFNALRITRAPSFGTARVEGLSIVFTPGVANAGATSLDYVIDLPFGPSGTGRINLVSNAVPGAQTLTAETVQGRPVTVRISNGAGGPFTAASVVSVSPATAGTATITGAGGSYDLTFAPAGTFSGQAVVTFTLTNAFGTTSGTLSIRVDERPDPALDPEVRGVATGQVTAARRFADAQIDNFQQRLRDLRDGSNASANRLNLNPGSDGDMERDPREDFRRQLGQQSLDPGELRDERTRDMLGLEVSTIRPDEGIGITDDEARLGAGQTSGAPGGGGAIGFWTAGMIDWGRQDAAGVRDSRFTTQGVSAGLDVRISDTLILGGGMGYGEDKTRIGDSGSNTSGQGVTGALYGSWRPASSIYLDGVVGYADLDFSSRRRVEGMAGQSGGYAEGERAGDVRFASASVGHIRQGAGLASDVYVRLDAREIALDPFIETGGGISALGWDKLEQTSLSANLGASWRWMIESRRLGQITPTVRLEWSHEFDDLTTQGVRYADWAASPTYLVSLDEWSRDALRLDLGMDWSLSDRLMLSLGYRGFMGDASTSHGGQIGLKIGW